MARSRCTFFEVLESRELFSVSPMTLSTDQMNLATAIQQYSDDKATSATVIAADKAAVKANKVQADPAVLPLITAWKEAILTRQNTLIADRSTLKTATNTDKIAVLTDRQDIRNDKADGNTAQLAIDQAQLGKDQLQLATDRSKYVGDLSDDIITTKATIASDHEAIIAKRLADGASSASIDARQQLVADSIHWVDTLAVDRKTIAADRLIVSHDEHG